jgi:HJR/Mrr/RecB family endonuclease
VSDSPTFEIGKRYTHEEVYRGLNVGNAGGVRPCLGKDGEIRRLVLMTSAPSARILSENPYHDRVEGDVLVYTAAGRRGDQGLSGINRRLVEQFATPFPVYGFLNIGNRRDKSLGTRRWEFLGLLELLRHFQEKQVDTGGQTRDAFVFEFYIHNKSRKVESANDLKISTELLTISTASKNKQDDREIAASPLVQPLKIAAIPPTESEQIRRQLLQLPPQKFEHVVKNALERTGFERVSVTRFSQDGGVDVNAHAGENIWPLKGLLVQVQAKRWLHSVGRREVAELRGSLKTFARGVVVTTSHYTKAAVVEANEIGKNPIVLVDGYGFAGIIHSSGVKID